MEYNCAHCGAEDVGMMGHYYMDGFTCDKGKENSARQAQGLPPKWDQGNEVDHVCPTCGQNVLK